MDYSKEVFPLNCFVLLSKGWLKLKSDYTRNSLDAIIEALKLDDYRIVKTWDDVLRIVTMHFSEYNEWRKNVGLTYWDFARFMYEISETAQKSYFFENDLDFNKDAIQKKHIVWSIMNYFAFYAGKGEIVLNAYAFSRFSEQKELFEKKGKFVIANSSPGMTYKTMNTILRNALKHN